MLKNKKGFTLIELLAVIIILGVLMLVAIPSVTAYINNSRKSAYVDTAKRLVDGAVILVNSGELDIYDTDTTYYIPGSCINTETGGETSPYGEWAGKYVVVTYSGDGYDYYWTSTDVTKMGVYLTYRDNLKIDNIKAGIESIEPDIAIGNREQIVVFSDCSNGDPGTVAHRIGDRESYDGTDPTPVASTTTNDNITWKNGSLQISMVVNNCWNDGKTCQPQITATNIGTSDTIVGFKATFTIPSGVRIVSGAYNNQDISVFISGNTLTIIGNPNKQVDRYINVNGSKSTGLQIGLESGTTFALSNGDITYTVLKPGNKTFVLDDIKVELTRRTFYNQGNNIRFIYNIAVTNKTSSTINGWSFKLNSTGISAERVISPLQKNASTSTYIDISAVSGSGSGYTLSAGQRIFYDSLLEFELEDVNDDITVTH